MMTTRLIVFIGIFVVTITSMLSAEPPGLSARDTGAYAISAWGDPAVPPAPGSTDERTDPLTFTVRSIWNNAASPNPDLSGIRQEIVHGWNYSPKRTMLVRVHFWNGEDRYQGPMLDRDVYLQRVLQSVQQLEPVLDKIHGITLSEENVPEGGRTQLLQYLYDGVKAHYPNLNVYQWWTPNTGHPKQFEGQWLSADGWVFDPYTLTANNPPYADLWKPDPYLRLVQKFVLTGTPVIAMQPATAETAFRPYYDASTTPLTNSETLWNLIEHQTRINTAFNIPTSFYWTSQDGTAYFPTDTSDPLLNQINQYVRNFATNQKNLPVGFNGEAAVADVWVNDPAGTIVAAKAQAANNIAFEERFAGSEFLEETVGGGLRDLIVNGSDLRTRGFNGRNADAEMVYHLRADNSGNFVFPLISLDANVNADLNGAARIYVSTNGVDWQASAQTTAAGENRLELATQGNNAFASVKNLWVKVQLAGDPGAFDQPAVRIDDLRVIQNAASTRAMLLNVNFDTDYVLGALDGQDAGVTGGKWIASPANGTFEVASTTSSGGNAARLSRNSSAGTAAIRLARSLDTSSGLIRFSFDFFRPNNSARGVVTLINGINGNNTGIGIEIPNGTAAMRMITDSLYAGGAGASTATAFTPANRVWYQIEFEVNAFDHTYDLFVRPRGAASRTLIADDVAWNAPNALVDQFLYLPQGLSESVLHLDNLLLMQIDISPGDADLDGDVDLSDLGALASHYGQVSNARWTGGDFDRDGDVDLNDLGALASYYGAGHAEAMTDFQNRVNVPEPAVIGAALALGMWYLERRGRIEARFATPAPDAGLAGEGTPTLKSVST